MPVRAEVVDIPDFSVHADSDELAAWLRAMPTPPVNCYVVHGEPVACTTLAGRLRVELDWCAVVPKDLEVVRLD